MLNKTMGSDRCLFGAECPGVGYIINPKTGRTMDDVKPMIDSFDWLSIQENQAIYEDNARLLFGLSEQMVSGAPASHRGD